MTCPAKRISASPASAVAKRGPVAHLPPPGTLMIGFPVLVIAMSWMDLRAGMAAENDLAGAANRGRTDEQHLCMVVMGR
jgi:hypothetical protein